VKFWLKLKEKHFLLKKGIGIYQTLKSKGIKAPCPTSDAHELDQMLKSFL